MSAVVTREREQVATRRARRPTTYAIRTARPRRVARRRGIHPVVAALRTAVWMGAVCLAAYLTSTLSGQMLMEQSRREGLRAQERSRQARMDVSLLRKRVTRLTSLKSIDDWASLRGFTQLGTSVVVNQEPTRVATLR